MDMATALAELGVTERTLDPATQERLDLDGYAPLPGMLTDEQLNRARTRVAELAAAEGEAAGREVHQETGTDRLADLVNKDPVFEVCFTEPRLLACLAHVLGDFKLSSLNSRAALPGQGLQALHTEGGPVGLGPYQVCNSIWLLDDFTEENGATRVVPGSHRRTVRVTLTAPAGTVIVFNSHLWHGGTRNDTDRPRRAVHSYFTRRGNGQQLNQREYIRQETRARLSPAAAFILDV
jgi:ectoine hydroxylase-related dioxygenase (phytanoyl-CoA dioxygenase family)